ncbi:MAG: DUF2156 domain-containing protein [Acidimicrobiia bacterium]|nr:DUF2156 domain-containing protein [Acidimicrobiia bacterium]
MAPFANDPNMLSVPAGGRVLVVGPLRLSQADTAASRLATAEVVRAVDDWSGPGVVVLAGDTFDLTAMADPSVERILAVHSRLRNALDSFAQAPEHELLILIGDTDRALGSEEGLARQAAKGLAAQVLNAVELRFETGTGERMVRVEWCPAETDNDDARSHARAAVADGAAGVVAFATPSPELTTIGEGFYANPGSCAEVALRVPARAGLPPVPVVERQLGFVELEAGAQLHVRLVHGATAVGGGLRRRLFARSSDRPEGRPSVIATFPTGPDWPPTPASPLTRVRRARRWAAGFIALTGVVNLVSALTPPDSARIRGLTDILPLAVAQAAHALVAIAGLGLLLLAGGIRRGQRLAWQAALGLLLSSAALHLAKGVDLEETLVAVAAAAYLLIHRSAFRAPSQPGSVRRALAVVAFGAVLAIVTAIAAVEVFHHGHGRPPLGRATLAVAERLVGITTLGISGRLDRFLTPSLFAVGVASVAAIGWILFRPSVGRRAAHGSQLAQARAVVRRYGGDTLAYFALRRDKRHFFLGDSVVAYASFGSVCLVSPDPIGPATERETVWTSFRQFADRQGWHVAVMGASEAWLPIYRRAGMHDVYVGDEAIVDCRRFSMEGGKSKGLRQAVNRVARNGYTVSFHDPSRVDATLRAAVEDLMAESRRGGVERGFSMTLGRMFDPEDRGLLLALASDAEGHPAAFCQYVPAPDIDGYSLDLMRRTTGDVPNGLTDFVVVETIRHLSATGHRGLALNFATMRAVLAGEDVGRPTARLERWVLGRMSDSMQIESLWYFNAKYDPEWRPRYAVYDSVESFAQAAVAIARAESFSELPVVGRLFRPGSSGGVET